MIDMKFFLESSQNVRELASPFLKAHGLNYFQYARSYKDGSHMALVNREDFLQARFEEGRGVRSSIQDQQNNLQNYVFLWNGNLPDADTNMARDFDLDNGICFVERFPDYYNLIAFAAPTKEKNTLNFYLNNMHVLKNFIYEFSQKAQRLIVQSDKKKLALPQPLQDKNGDKLLWDKSKTISIIHENIRAELSLREYQCIQGCARGLGFQEIAKSLALSPRTVETYLERTKNKLGVSKKSELIQIYQKNFSL